MTNVIHLQKSGIFIKLGQFTIEESVVDIDQNSGENHDFSKTEIVNCLPHRLQKQLFIFQLGD